MLFILVIEERNLIYPESRDEELNKKRKVYYDHYSIQRLTNLAERKIYVDPRKTDLWQSLLTTFRLFEKGYFGQKLGIEPLGSGLFSPAAIGLLSQTQMSNESLLSVLRNLVMFENENKQLTRVNYADLDVEEFGSVYEGLLEFDPKINDENGVLQFSFVEGTGRSSSGSHYTPEELVKPLIKHSLDYIIEDKLKEGKQAAGDEYARMKAQCEALLAITVCDVACGSGHILLSAARRIGLELAILRESIASRSMVEQPSPPFLREAIRDVIRHCIYGVDLNPLAVELCKVAFWLEAHNPGEPLNFLDHRIKCGNAIVGLAHVDELYKGIPNEAFKALPGDDKDVARELLNRNKKEQRNTKQIELAQRLAEENVQKIVGRMNEWASMPEKTPAEIEAKAKAYATIVNSSVWWRLKVLADIQVSQFFIHKENASDLATTGRFIQYLVSQSAVQGQAVGISLAKGAEKRFFHWFLEFPEVFVKGGFDCVMGNPPYLGGQKLSGSFGSDFLNYLNINYSPTSTMDLVGYFFRRIFDVINKHGFMSLITTKSVAEGSTRLGSLKEIQSRKGSINFAIKSMKWPGEASVDISLITINKGRNSIRANLDGSMVDNISSLLDNQDSDVEPKKLDSNLSSCFQGAIPLGEGFLLTESERRDLIKTHSKSEEVIQPFLNGKDINNDPLQHYSRYVINFRDFPLNKSWDISNNDPIQGAPYASDFYACLKRIEQMVKPEREKNKRKIRREIWWQFAEKASLLHNSISDKSSVMVQAQTSKDLCPIMVDTENKVFSMMCIVFISSDFSNLSLLNSSIHHAWAWKYCSKNSISLRYTPSTAYDTFPFPIENDQNQVSLRLIGEHYETCRKSLMKMLNLGLTKTYNQFHNVNLVRIIDPLDSKLFEKKHGKETRNLYNHLEIKRKGGITYEEAVPLIFKLRELHKEMDEAVLAAYGWHEDSEKWGKAIRLRHDFYEVDYLPENDRVRYTIHPEARKEVLKRLLLLNHERFEDEVAKGLHKRKDVEAYYQQKGKAVPEGTVFSDGKSTRKKSTKNKVENSSKDYGKLFD
jgi:type I restriction-modification system DNA methylase subunit